MKASFEWNHEDVYLSNNGRGPLKARILCATDKTVTIEWWKKPGRKNQKRTRCKMPLTFFNSPRCGWKLQP